MNIRFKNQKHVKRYQDLISRMRCDDAYHKSVAYLIALNDDCYNHISDIFNLDRDRIVLDGITSAWQTSGSLSITRLVFNLWSGCCSDYIDDNDEISSDYSACWIFYNSDALYMFEAVKLRYPEMFCRVNLEERTLQIMIDQSRIKELEKELSEAKKKQLTSNLSAT